LIIILLLASSMTFAGFKYLVSRAEPAPIFKITPTSIKYGDTTITGTLQKDAPAGQSGNFILALSDMRIITLDVQGIDHLIAVPATVTGVLSPDMTMTVQSITIAQE